MRRHVRRRALSCMVTSSWRVAAVFHGCRSETGSDRTLADADGTGIGAGRQTSGVFRDGSELRC